MSRPDADPPSLPEADPPQPEHLQSPILTQPMQTSPAEAAAEAAADTAVPRAEPSPIEPPALIVPDAHPPKDAAAIAADAPTPATAPPKLDQQQQHQQQQPQQQQQAPPSPIEITPASPPASASASASAAPPRDQPETTFYRIKWTLNSADQSVPICMQGRNGPCPLLALANASILRDDITIPPGTTRISEPDLMALLAEFVSSRSSAAAADLPPDAAAVRDIAVTDFLDLLPCLTTGMNVNPRFSGPLDFEFTRELSAFDVFPNLRLVHGWLVDPQDSRLLVALGGLSYNQLIDELVRTEPPGSASFEAAAAGGVDGGIAAATAPPPEAFDDDKYNSGEFTATAPVWSEHAATETTGSSTQPDPEEDEVQASESTVTANIRELRPAVVDFLESNPTQMTVFGLAELHTVLRPDEIAILFRNSHFYVLRKHNGELYTLVTDEGFLDELNTVWEKLVDVNGDSMFYNGAFLRINADGSIAGAGASALRPPNAHGLQSQAARETAHRRALQDAARGGAPANTRGGGNMWDTSARRPPGRTMQQSRSQQQRAQLLEQQQRKKKGGRCTIQ